MLRILAGICLIAFLVSFPLITLNKKGKVSAAYWDSFIYFNFSRRSHRRFSVKKFLAISQHSQKAPVPKRLWHRCFAVNFVKFLRTPFFIKHLRWLLLEPLKLFTISGIFQVQSFPSLNQKITLIHIDS